MRPRPRLLLPLGAGLLAALAPLLACAGSSSSSPSLPLVADGIDNGSCSGDECFALLQVRQGASSSLGVRAGERKVDCELDSNSLEFDRLVGSCAILAEKDYKFAHEAPVYIPTKDTVLFASNRLGEGADQTIQLLTVSLKTGKVKLLPDRIWQEEIVMSNGGTLDFKVRSQKYCADKADSVLIASQGNLNKSSGIYRLNLDTLAVDLIVNTSSWDDVNFNSLNDVVIDPVTGALLFTDPIYGYFQSFRPHPELGNWVWGYNPGASSPQSVEKPQGVQLLADGFERPNGIAFANERGDTLLVTDTGLFPGAESVSEQSIQEYFKTGNKSRLRTEIDTNGPRTTYSFDVKRSRNGQITSLTNRRILFEARSGVPDGIKVDCDGRIYAGVGDGVDVFNKDGLYLGTMKTTNEFGCANLVLVPRGSTSELIALCETRIYKFKLRTQTCSLGNKFLWPWEAAAKE